MMSVAPVASAGGAAGYYSNADNYYFLGNLQSLWLGEGAKALGLEGNVRADALTAVLEGRLPDGSRLGKEINGNHVHRPGHDLTFSAPKSVSILALIGEDKSMLDAHNHAVRVAAGYVEKLISARDTKDGVTSIVHTGKMVAAAFTHDTSRNLDPQLHTHLLVANMTELNGKWKALATDYIHDAGFIETVMKMQVTLGKIYRSALRQQVEALGHEVEEVGKHGMWEIKGVPEEVREDLSSRGREIQGAVGAEATLRSRDVAAKDTRQAKVDPSRLRLMERWLGQLKDRGYDLKAYQASVVPREDASREMRPQPVKPEHEMPDNTMYGGKHELQTAEPFETGTANNGIAQERSQVTPATSSRQPVLNSPGPVGESTLTAKIIPATRRFPEPALALPVYDNNGKSAGLALVSLVSSPEGRLTQGDTRMVMTERARGAVLQRSQSGNTVVVKDLAAALDAVRTHPKDGVVWQTGQEAPSANLMKVTGGQSGEQLDTVVRSISREDMAVLLPESMQQMADETITDVSRIKEQDALRQSAEEALAVKTAGQESTKTTELPAEKIVLPVEEIPDIRAELFGGNEKTAQTEPDLSTIRSISNADGSTESDSARRPYSQTGPEMDKAGAERSGASRVISELTNAERDIARQQDASGRGRMPEIEEQTLTRTIQKER
ncbi:MobF family relaxase (plasmid) [Leclercia pneumoniae]